MKSLEYKYLFVRQDLIDGLNKLGYVHFVTKESVETFEEGRAFYYCPENKKYGYVDVVPYEESANIKQNEEYIFNEIEKLKKPLSLEEQFASLNPLGK